MPFRTLCFGAIFAVISLSCNSGCGPHEHTNYYQEQHRPQFHFSPETAWMNDPNGLVYHEGEYHLFYQHYPDSTVWGPMHWGHAVSKDLVHWEHLPIALYPDSLGYIFSGSAVVDKDNTSGFGKDGNIPLVAIFTHHDPAKAKAGAIDVESQSIAYSLDKGRTWTKYSGNPVVPNPGIRNYRDPKVFWHEESKHWIMPIAAHDHLEFYKSRDLKAWDKSGVFGQGHGSHDGVWECPDIFPLKMRDGRVKWILIQNMDRGAINGGSGAQYFIGNFDGNVFINDYAPEQTLWLDYGADNYAGVTWFNAPDDRRIFIGWMSQWFDYAQTVPTQAWRSALTVPRDLYLMQTDGGLILGQYPVKELQRLRKDSISLNPQTVNDSLLISDKHMLIELDLEFDMTASTSAQFGFLIKNTLGEEVKIGYQQSDSTLFVDRTKSGKTDFSERYAVRHSAPYVPGSTLKIKALIDVSSVEVFVDDGRVALTEIFFPNQDYTITQIYSSGGSVSLKGGKCYGLKGIW